MTHLYKLLSDVLCVSYINVYNCYRWPCHTWRRHLSVYSLHNILWIIGLERQRVRSLLIKFVTVSTARGSGI